MALPNMIKVGDRVTFGRSGETKVAGRVTKKNPKSARIKTRSGDFVVTYNFIQKVSTKKKTAAAKKKATKRKATGKKVCAVPVRGPRRVKKNPTRQKTRMRKNPQRSKPANKIHLQQSTKWQHTSWDWQGRWDIVDVELENELSSIAMKISRAYYDLATGKGSREKLMSRVDSLKKQYRSAEHEWKQGLY